VLLVLAVSIWTDMAALFKDSTVRDCSKAVLARAGFGYLEKEEAAFIVTGGDGYRCVPWPSTNEPSQASFRGRMPGGTVAIVHSHPSSDPPQPSSADVLLAKRLGTAIIVVSRDHVYAARADGTVVTVVRKRRWAAR
jgi:hypothetical protein